LNFELLTMTITLLIGDDRHAIEREIAQYKRQIDPAWQHFNFHRFDSSQLEAAISCARSAPFGAGQKAVVVEGCNFPQFGEEGLAALQCLPHLPATTHLLFTGASLDRRLKVSRHLLKHCQLQEFTLISPWRTDLIAREIATQAKSIPLGLTQEAVHYLAEAIGNDTTRLAAELDKLATFANDSSLSLETVRSLVPATTQTSIQLAAAMRQGEAKQVAVLLEDLLARGEYPLVIVAALSTQFRTWLWVKAALDGGMRKDWEIAQLCGIGNPKRLYFLRPEVRGISLLSLSQALAALLDLEVALKTHAGKEALLPALLQITASMASAK
jgi:DNA polymerase-3 subunit delta